MAILLSVYFLVLNFTPCSDTDQLANDSHTEIVSGFDNNHDHSASDLCSPFCQCHCCHVHTIDFGVTTFEPIVNTISSKVFFHIDNVGEDFLHTILHPPRV